MKQFMKILGLTGVLVLALFAGTCYAEDAVDAAEEKSTAPVEEVAEVAAPEQAEGAQADTVSASEEAAEEPKADEGTEEPKTDAEQPAEPGKDPEDGKTEEPAPEQKPAEISPENPAEITIVVNGETLVFDDHDIKPYVTDDDRTLVPLRKLGEALHATVGWRASDDSIHLFRDETSVTVTIGSPELKKCQYDMGEKFTYSSNGESFQVDQNNANVTPIYKTEVIDGEEITRTMIPFRAICEAFGGKVDWDASKPNLIVVTVAPYEITADDRDAANYIQNWNYYPDTVLKTGSVSVKVSGNFEGGSALGDGVEVTIGDQTQTTANGGVCTFTEIAVGSYTVTVNKVPEGYQAMDATVTVEAGKENTVTVNLEKIPETTEEK